MAYECFQPFDLAQKWTVHIQTVVLITLTLVGVTQPRRMKERTSYWGRILDGNRSGFQHFLYVFHIICPIHHSFASILFSLGRVELPLFHHQAGP